MAAQVDVVVIGAGLAGLSAAATLAERGADVVVLEARDRVGGRTHTVRQGWEDGQHADLGAELIDEGQNAILDLCDRLGIELSPEFSLLDTEIVLGGRRLAKDESRVLRDELRQARSAARPAAYEPLAAWANRARLSPQATAFAEAGGRMNPMTSIRECDTQIFFQVPSGRRCWRVASGTDSIACALADTLDIRLGEHVRVVRHDLRGVVAETPGEQFACRRAVVAVPAPITLELGFDPPLEEPKIEALLSLPYGSGGKVIGQYTEGDALRERLGSGCITDGAPGLVWNTAAHQEGGAVIAAGLVGGDATPALDDGPGALMELDGLMSALVGHAVSRVNGLTHNWSHDPLARGTISAPFGAGRRLIPLLAAPAGRLHFAGEHTDDEWPSYMEGAVRSGRRVADEIAARERWD